MFTRRFIGKFAILALLFLPAVSARADRVFSGAKGGENPVDAQLSIASKSLKSSLKKPSKGDGIQSNQVPASPSLNVNGGASSTSQVAPTVTGSVDSKGKPQAMSSTTIVLGNAGTMDLSTIGGVVFQHETSYNDPWFGGKEYSHMPEPSSLVLISTSALPLLGAWFRRRRRFVHA